MKIYIAFSHYKQNEGSSPVRVFFAISVLLLGIFRLPSLTAILGVSFAYHNDVHENLMIDWVWINTFTYAVVSILRGTVKPLY